VNNWQAMEIRAAADAREGLYQQIPNPVRWTDSIRKIASLGITRFIEAGPGGVLTGLCRQIDPTLKSVRFGEPADLEKVKDAQS
jgi:[acyl-carrier-protein] S-malonyltransferase